MSDANADRVLDEIVARVRAQNVPAYPGDAIAAMLVDRDKKRTSYSTGFRRLIRLHSLQFAAAAALVGIIVGAIWLASGLSGSSGIAFAQVQTAIGDARTVSYRILQYSTNPKYYKLYNLKEGEPPTTKAMILGTSRSRIETARGDISITNQLVNERILISPGKRTALIEPLYPAPDIAKLDEDFLTTLRNIPEKAAKKIGERQLDGRQVIDFAVHIQDRDFTVTVDPVTKLPIRMEMVHDNVPSGDIFRDVYTDFVFDAPLDESLFRIEAPAGYTVRNHIPPKDRPPSPTPDPLILSGGESIGPVKLGASIEEIVRLLGQPDWQEEVEPYSAPGTKSDKPPKRTGRTHLSYDTRGFRLTVDDKNRLGEIFCFTQRGMGGSGLDFQGKTKEGITWQSSRDDVVKMYGEPDEEPKSDGMDDLIYHARGYQFSFYNGKLGSMSVVPSETPRLMKPSAGKTMLRPKDEPSGDKNSQ